MLEVVQWLQAAVCLLSVPCRQWPVLTVSQVMAPLLDDNHELNWQANMVDAIERKTANQHTEGESFVAPLSLCTRVYSKKQNHRRMLTCWIEDGIPVNLCQLACTSFFGLCGIPESHSRIPVQNHTQSCLCGQTECYSRISTPE